MVSSPLIEGSDSLVQLLDGHRHLGRYWKVRRPKDRCVCELLASRRGYKSELVLRKIAGVVAKGLVGWKGGLEVVGRRGGTWRGVCDAAESVVSLSCRGSSVDGMSEIKEDVEQGKQLSCQGGW